MARFTRERECKSLVLVLSVIALFCMQSIASFQTAPTATCKTRRSHINRHFRFLPRHAINGERKKGDAGPSAVEKTPANNNFIGLTTNGGKYCPDGLTPKEYEDIKKKEAEKVAKMDFAAWGPRFKRTEAPEGDWMVKPGLWIQGFQNGPSNTVVSKEEWERKEARKQQLAIFRSVATSFLFAYVLLDILLLSSASIRSTSTGKKVVASIFAKNGVLQALKQHFLSSLALSKLQLVKLSLAAIVTPSLLKYREVAQRRWLWSKRRQFGTPLLASVAVAATWSSVILRMATAIR